MAESLTDRQVDQACQQCLRKGVDRMADIYCQTCEEFQCCQCTKIHDKYDFMKNHETMSVTEGQIHISSNVEGDVDMKGMDICAEHRKQFEFYCRIHKALLCSQCASINHMKCKRVVKIESIIGGDECDILMTELSKSITSTEQDIELLDEAENRLSDDVGNLPDKLKIMRTRLIEAFDEFSDEVLQDTTVYGDTKKLAWSSEKVKGKTNVKSMKNTATIMEPIVKYGSSYQKFIAECRMKTEIEQLVKAAYSSHKTISSINISYTCDEQLSKLKSSMLSILEGELFDIKITLPCPSKLTLLKSINLQQSHDDVGDPIYSGLTFLADHRLVVTDNKNGKCLLYDVNLNVKNSYKLPYNHPQCVTAVSDDEVVVTSSRHYRLDFLNVSDTNNMSLNRTCKVNAEYFSISMMDDKNFVVGTIDHIKPFRIVSMSGEEKDFSVQLPSKEYPIGTNFTTFLEKRENVVQSSADEDKIYIYDIESGEKVVITDNKIKSPGGVAVGPYDHVFVCSMDTKCLVEITPGGRVLSSHQVDMKYPRSIAISKDKKLLAISNGSKSGRKLSLYKFT